MAFEYFQTSLKAKVAAFFGLLGVLFVVEGAFVILFWKKTGAVSRQIEVVLEAKQINQDAQTGYRGFLTERQESPPENWVGLFEQASTLLKTVRTGGRAGASNLRLPAASDLLKPSLDKVIELQQSQKETWLSLHAKRIALSSSEKTSNDTIPAASDGYETILQGAIALDGVSKSVSSTFEQLMRDLRSEEEARQAELAWLIAVIVLIDLIALGYLFVLLSQKLFTPLREIAQAAISQQISHNHSTDEIGLVANNLNTIISQLRDATHFIQSTGDGNLDAKLAGDNTSALSQSLINMQQKLKAINDEEQKRKWSTEGLARFVEILRSGESNVAALGDSIIKELVTYTRSAQGALYIWNDDETEDPFIELIATYAFNRKKHEEKKIKAGDGLLGQAFLEKATTHLTEIPADYFRIVSGLGEADPHSILIVPLLSDNRVYGLVELASLRKYEAHEITFVEKLGEAVASTLASVKTNEVNKRLLMDFQQQTESMRSQEEEMRQNMEELTATQEEMSRKEQDYIRQIEELNSKVQQTTADGQWETAQQASDALKTNLQTLQLTIEELRKLN